MPCDKKELLEFVSRWQGRGYEKGDTQQFWLQLLRTIGYSKVDDVLFEFHVSSGGFIDVWIPDAGVLIEQKALGIDLDKEELRQGKQKTPLTQALDYVDELPRLDQPRFVITCNFSSFRVYDRDAHGRSQLPNNAFEFTLDELANHPEYLAFINDPTNSRLEKEKTVSIKAGELIGKLYDKLREGYINPDSEESMHALNVLCVRLVFCLYCEDAGLFGKDAFYNYLKDVPANRIRAALKNLFRALDTNLPERDPYDLEVKAFPYVNGGLFRDESEVPNFTDETKDFLLNEVSSHIDWSQISPTIFGGIFESTLNPETRRSGGMHYTSPENIHKVIDPLFLDDLKEELKSICTEEGTTPRKRENSLKRFHEKICSLTFFDPACGSGNFLTETYICLRKLENAVLRELRQGQVTMGFGDEDTTQDRVNLGQFYGIEINDFAVTVAETALWISRLKANGETSMFFEMGGDDFPLHESAHIVHGNALRMDWNIVLPAAQCSFIMGNPPFYGGKLLAESQREEIRALFGKIKLVNSIDYVSGWYMKACDYMESRSAIRAALVSTNSITQGEQVFPVWNTLHSKYPLHINFAWRTFIWDSEASDKAHVHVVIIGFSVVEDAKEKYLFDGGDQLSVSHINSYLIDGPDVIVEVVASPIDSSVRPCVYGSLINDGSNYIFKPDELEEFLKAEPRAKDYVRPLIGSEELINGKQRFVLYLKNITAEELDSMPEVKKRVEKVRQLRAKSRAEATRKTAETSHRFYFDGTCDERYLVLPSVSSERRSYVPIDFAESEVVPTNLVSTVEGAGLYEFGILTSQMHNDWMRVVAGRLKSSYRYSPKTVYNTFPWPEPTDEQRKHIEHCAQGVLDARENHSEDSLAKMYDGISPMPENPGKADLKKFEQGRYADLLAAHKALDAAVEAAYGVNFGGDEEKIVAHLFKLYAEKAK